MTIECLVFVGNVIGFKVKMRLEKMCRKHDFRSHTGIVDRKITRAIENELQKIERDTKNV